MTDPHADFAFALAAAGLRLTAEPVMDGEWHRAPADGDTGQKRSGSYRGYLDCRPAGQIVNHRTGYNQSWVSNGEASPPSAVVIKERRAATAAIREATERQASRPAYAVWANAAPAVSHPYLTRKGIGAHGARIDSDDTLLIPMRDASGWLWNLQTISRAGTKLYAKNARKQGLYALLGAVTPHRPILVAEGFATGATLHEVLSLPVTVAFDSANLLPVGLALRSRYPEARIIVCGDNDHHLPRRDPPLPNVGIEKAREAAAAVNGLVVVPTFSPDNEATDWNDLWLSCGAPPLCEAFDNALTPTGCAESELSRRSLTAARNRY